jgi:hypothetical protein
MAEWASAEPSADIFASGYQASDTFASYPDLAFPFSDL